MSCQIRIGDRVYCAEKAKHACTVDECEVTDECRTCPHRIELPSIAKRAVKYVKATTEWVVKGRPTRSDEQVKTIFDTFCAGCQIEGTCPLCGCRVSKRGPALLNKIKMATQHCPKKKW